MNTDYERFIELVLIEIEKSKGHQKTSDRYPLPTEGPIEKDPPPQSVGTLSSEGCTSQHPL